MTGAIKGAPFNFTNIFTLAKKKAHFGLVHRNCPSKAGNFENSEKFSAQG